MYTPVVNEIVKKLESLPSYLQRQVLIFVEALQTSATRGNPGEQLLKFAGIIPEEDLKIMQQVIETGCEQVDANEW